MPKEEKPCPHCDTESPRGNDSKCPDCGAWQDSYGTVHKKNCEGGFHDKCPEPKKPRR
jgi:hypothetical protein